MLKNSGRRDAIKARAHGQWRSILERAGVDSRLLDGKGHPCPVCPGGRDRFTFTDKFGNGDYYCRHCGHGDGLQLMQAVLGVSFAEALSRVEAILGVTIRDEFDVPKKNNGGEQMKKLAKKIWDEASPIGRGDEVDKYLRARGLGMEAYPKALRCHPSLAYYARAEGQRRATVVARYAAMIAALVNHTGRAVTLHRTYVTGGRKAPVEEPKKLLSGFEAGASIRLCEAGEELAVTEGIETALAVHIATGKPVWAATSATNMAALWIPHTVKRVCIYGDNDVTFTGAAAAYALAKRLRTQHREGGRPPEVQVYLPRNAGEDWADVFLRRQHLLAA